MNRSLQKILVSLIPILISKLLRGKSVFKIIALLLLVLLGGAWIYFQFISSTSFEESRIPVSENSKEIPQEDPTDIRALFEAQRSGVMVSTTGNVTRILSDDTKGSRHQRFLIELPQGMTLLVAHNIDLAPRIPLNINDHVDIFGQYEWNHKGGLIHWTHHDPKNIHPGGWIIHNKVKYE